MTARAMTSLAISDLARVIDHPLSDLVGTMELTHVSTEDEMMTLRR